MISIKKLQDMTGRRVLITGGTGYLGSVIAEVMAELGAKIILLDRPGADFYKIIESLRNKYNADCWCVECDLEFEQSREEAIDLIKADRKGLNCLINNAAFVGTSDLDGWVVPFEKQSMATWRRAIEVNMTAPFHLAQAFARELTEAEGGNILNITSIYGEMGPDWSLYENTSMGNPAAYAVTKGGLAQLTRWLATTLAPNVRVNAISPGGILRNQPRSFIEKYNKRTPLGRMASETDFPGAIAYLATDASSYVTGQILSVDGGWGAW